MCSVWETETHKKSPRRRFFGRIKHMRFDKLSNRLRWGIIGGFLGGLIAVIGFGIFTILGFPPSDSSLISVIFFVIPRVIIGSIVAMIIGPILTTKLAKNKSK